MLLQIAFAIRTIKSGSSLFVMGELESEILC
ncbi:MAG: hypothetical protein QG605_2097, partial [Euryarchaeota archaeon]|nr:hypothetical protein [Euryarchaeota archaeon]